MKFRTHQEARFLIVSPPSYEPGQVERLRMTFVYKRSRDRSGSGVQIFVRAPRSEVYIPVVHIELEIPRGVCEIETDDRTNTMSGFGNGPHGEGLAGVIVHAAEENERDLGTMPLDHVYYVFGLKDRFSVARR